MQPGLMAGREMDMWRGSSLDSRRSEKVTSNSPELWEELSCRRRTLKVINTRPVLVAICTLVVIECACVLAELMVDLQGIKFRFENEEKEVNRFVEFLKQKYPEEVGSWGEASSVEDLINRIKDSLVVRSSQEIVEASIRAACCCPCDQQDSNKGSRTSHNYGGRSTIIPNNNDNKDDSGAASSNDNSDSYPRSQHASHQNTPYVTSDGKVSTSSSSSASASSCSAQAHFDSENLFVVEINNVKASFFLVAEFAPEHIHLNETKHWHYETEYMRIHKASTALHITSLVILSFMVIETIVKFVCMGTAFLKRKFEVFDAFIVISSFALDFVFLDSRWYETGKDAATILVLLLPWRVVRIVNSFLMTVKHKHHIAIMTIKRAKKRADFKNAKLQALLSEIRKDVQLLVALCRNSEVPESEITACLYGLGRRSTTLNAVTSCTTIMLVSALGKDASLEDEIYGKLFADALRDPVEHDSEPEAKKAEEEAIDAAIALEKQLEQQSKKAARQAGKTQQQSQYNQQPQQHHHHHKRGARGQVTRSYTVPRRAASIEHNLEAANGGSGGGSATTPTAASSFGGGVEGDNNGSIFYINDAFATPRARGAGVGGGGGDVNAAAAQRRRMLAAASSPETLAGLAAGGGGGCGGGGGGGGGGLGGAGRGEACEPVAEEEGGGGGGGGVGQDCRGERGGGPEEEGNGAGEGNGGSGGGGGRESWEGRLPPKCKSKASVRSLPGQSYVTFEVTTQVTYL